jgi:hypothetical protein
MYQMFYSDRRTRRLTPNPHFARKMNVCKLNCRFKNFLGEGTFWICDCFIDSAQAARVAQWLERRRKDLVILASPVRNPLWDVGASPLDETVETEVPCRSKCLHEKELSLLNYMTAKHRPKFTVLSPVMVTATR